MGCELYLSIELFLRKQIYICVYIYIHIYIIYNVYIYIFLSYIYSVIYIYIYTTERQTDMKIINTKNQDSVCGTLVFQDRTRCQKTFRENGCEG